MRKKPYEQSVAVEKPGPRLACLFYRQEDGTEPVREWLREQDADLRKQVGSDIEDVQWRWPVGEPLVGALGEGLYEVRTTFDRNEYRVLFTVAQSALLLLYAFHKKTQKTPKRYLEIARNRMP